jgi:hypothetical protein
MRTAFLSVMRGDGGGNGVAQLEGFGGLKAQFDGGTQVISAAGDGGGGCVSHAVAF